MHYTLSMKPHKKILFLAISLAALSSTSAQACNAVSALADLKSKQPETRIQAANCAKSLRQIPLSVQLGLVDLLGDEELGDLKGLSLFGGFSDERRKSNARVNQAGIAALENIKLDPNTLDATLLHMFKADGSYQRVDQISVLNHFAYHGMRASVTEALIRFIQPGKKGYWQFEDLLKKLQNNDYFARTALTTTNADPKQAQAALDLIVQAKDLRDLDLIDRAIRDGIIGLPEGLNAMQQISGKNFRKSEQYLQWKKGEEVLLKIGKNPADPSNVSLLAIAWRDSWLLPEEIEPLLLKATGRKFDSANQALNWSTARQILTQAQSSKRDSFSLAWRVAQGWNDGYISTEEALPNLKRITGQEFSNAKESMDWFQKNRP
jgi:hypothetical protein